MKTLVVILICVAGLLHSSEIDIEGKLSVNITGDYIGDIVIEEEYGYGNGNGNGNGNGPGHGDCPDPNIPEPSSIILTLAACGLAFRRQRRK